MTQIVQCRRRVEKKLNAGKVMIPIQNILQEYFRLFVQNVTEIYINKSKTFFFHCSAIVCQPKFSQEGFRSTATRKLSINVITTNFGYSTRTVQFAFIA